MATEPRAKNYLNSNGYGFSGYKRTNVSSKGGIHADHSCASIKCTRDYLVPSTEHAKPKKLLAFAVHLSLELRNPQ